MANIVGLALKVNADATGLRLDPAERALKKLGDEANKVTKVFNQFTKDSGAATEAQKKFSTDLSSLNSALKAGQITAKQYAEEFAKLADAANEEAAALRRAAEITARFEPEVAKFARTQAELRSQLDAGRITQETYNAAIEDAARKLTDAERAALGLAQRSQEIAAASQGAALKFNELSGILSILPGPLGSIAGRISGITSASTGLARVFSGGLTQGAESVRASVAALVNPFTATAAAIVGVAAASRQVASGLVQLEDRVERLGNLATQLGTSFQFVQVLEEAGKRTGVSIEAVSGAMTRLQVTLAGADEESQRATKALDNLGISVDDLSGLSEQGKIELLAKQLGGIEDPVKRSAAAVQLFGRSGTQLLPFFRQLGGAADDLQRFGGAIKDEDKQRIDDVGKSLDALNVASRALQQNVLIPFANAFKGVVDVAASATGVIAELARAIGTVLTPVLNQVGATLTTVAAGIQAFGNLFKSALELVTPILDSIGKFLLPAIVAQVAFLNRAILVGAISGLARSFTAAAAAASSYGVAGGLATAATVALSTAVRALIASTGIGALVIGAGLVTERLLSWAFASNEAAGEIKKTQEAAEQATRAAEKYGEAIAEIIKGNEGFGKTLDAITKSVEDAKLKSVEFGQAGFDAAVRFEESIASLKDKLGRELFNEETFKIEAEKARVAFNAALERISEESKLEIEIDKDTERTLRGLQNQINEVVDDSTRLGQAGFDAALQFQGAIQRLQEQVGAGIVNSETIAREARKAREEYDAQVKSIEAATRAQQQQIDNDRKRVESLLQVNNVAQRITDDIASVDREIARVQEEFARAVAEFDGAAAINAQRRIAELDLLQSRLSKDLQAATQGFEQGFDKAFEATNKNIERLTAQANKFGDAGAEAARRLQEGIAAAQVQARDGILRKEAFEAEVQRREELFAREIEQVRQVADERKRVNDFVDQQFQLARFGGDQQRLAAAQRVAEIEREIIRVQQDVRVARAAGNQEAVNEGIQRLGLLDQVAAKERDIASGRKQFEDEIAKARQQYLQQIQRQQQQAEQQQKKFIDERNRAIEAEANRQRNRIRELNTLGAGVISGSDLRTSEGAAQFLRLASQQQDPALIEARLQTRRLTELRDAVIGLSQTFAGPVVQIGAGVG